MLDVSKYTLDTSVRIKILDPGIWLPELETYTPVISYASIDKIISMLNRGIEVTFPDQSDQQEISKKIEDILLDYEDRKNYLKQKRHMSVGTDINTALDTIQEINDSKITAKEIQEEKDRHIFDHSDITERIVKDLSNQTFARVFDSDDYITAEERIERAEKERISRKSIAEKRKERIKMLSSETEIYTKLAQDGQYNQVYDDEDIVYDDPAEGKYIDYKKVEKRKK